MCRKGRRFLLDILLDPPLMHFIQKQKRYFKYFKDLLVLFGNIEVVVSCNLKFSVLDKAPNLYQTIPSDIVFIKIAVDLISCGYEKDRGHKLWTNSSFERHSKNLDIVVVINFRPRDYVTCPSSTKQVSGTYPLPEPLVGSPHSIQTPSGSYS